MRFDSSILNPFGIFSVEEMAQFERKSERRSYSKNDKLLMEGQVCKSFCYILSGAAYQYSIDDIDENIIELHVEKEWCLNHFSFVNQKPSQVTIKAYADLEVIEINVHSIHELIASSPA